MVVDSHAHVFQHWQGACGHPSSAVHLKYLQKVVTRPAARTYRARDGAQVAPTMLFREGDNTWAGLTDVDFRVGRFGQLAFTHEGEDYFVQYLPVGMQELACPPELMLAQMIERGRRPLHPAGRRRLRRDERLQRVRAAPASRQVHRAAERRRSHGRPGRARWRKWTARSTSWDCGASTTRRTSRATATRATWTTRRSCRSGTRSSRASCRCSSSCRRPRPMTAAATSATSPRSTACSRAIPRIRFLLVMGPPVAHFGKSGAWQFPPDVLATYRRDNLWLEVMFPITWGGVWDYPYPEAQALIRGMRDMLRRGQARVGLGHAQRRAVLHVPAMRRLRAPALRFPERRARRTPFSAATSPDSSHCNRRANRRAT